MTYPPSRYGRAVSARLALVMALRKAFVNEGKALFIQPEDVEKIDGRASSGWLATARMKNGSHRGVPVYLHSPDPISVCSDGMVFEWVLENEVIITALR